MGDSFKYSLRFCCDPGFNDQAEIPSLLKYVDAARIDDVSVFANVEEINTGHTTREELALYMELIARIQKELEPKGITTSINNWPTIMHADFGKKLREGQDFRLMTDPYGNEAQLCVCPLGEEWQKYIVSLFEKYASLKPNILWIEDDFRFHNHDPLIWGGCFCEAHMALYSACAGKALSREEFVAGLLQPGEVHPYRKIWLDTCRQTLNALAKRIGDAVHTVSKDTRVGLMSSVPQVHAAEGRKWEDILRGLAADTPPVNRTHLPGYMETAPSVYMRKFNMVAMLTRAMVPEDTEIYPELENFPFSRFTKSLRFTRFQMLASMPLNPSGLTIDLYDLNGNGIVWQEGYQDMLRDTKDYLNGLACTGVFKRQADGIKVMFHEDSSYFLHTRLGKSMEELYPEEAFFAGLLPAFGVPAAYCSNTAVKNSILAVSGQYLRNLTKDQTETLFKNNFIILNGDAAFTLFDMGLGRLAGMEDAQWLPENEGYYAYEQVCNGKAYCGMTRARASASISCSDALRVEYGKDKKVRHFTMLHDAYRSPALPGLTLVGDRVCVYPFGRFRDYLDIPSMLLNNIRQALMQDVILHADRACEMPPMVLHDPYIHPYYYRTEEGGALYLVNGSTDHYRNITLYTGKVKAGRIQALRSEDNRLWEVVFQQEGDTLRLNLPLGSLETVLLYITG